MKGSTEAAAYAVMRSLLFVPGDSEKKLAKADGIEADALILDLEDAVVVERKAAARGLVREYLGARPDQRRQQLWVRINPLDHAEAGADLGAVMPLRPDGIVLPKTRSPDDIEVLGRRMGTYEAEYDFQVGSTRILPVATETPQSLFSLGDYARCSKRLAGITWAPKTWPQPSARRPTVRPPAAGPAGAQPLPVRRSCGWRGGHRYAVG